MPQTSKSLSSSTNGMVGRGTHDGLPKGLRLCYTHKSKISQNMPEMSNFLLLSNNYPVRKNNRW